MLAFRFACAVAGISRSSSDASDTAAIATAPLLCRTLSLIVRSFRDSSRRCVCCAWVRFCIVPRASVAMPNQTLSRIERCSGEVGTSVTITLSVLNLQSEFQLQAARDEIVWKLSAAAGRPDAEGLPSDWPFAEDESVLDSARIRGINFSPQTLT
jgi:hypothetical protein